MIDLGRWTWVGVLLAVAAGPRESSGPPAWLGPATHVAPGVDFYQTTDRSLVAGAGPIAVSVLRLDPARVRVASVLARPGEVDSAEPLDRIAAAYGAVAAVNGSLFNAGNHEPVGILKVAGQLVSDSASPEGVVVIRSPARGATVTSFDLVAVTDALSYTVGHETRTVAIDGVDTTRARGRLMLYTPMYHADTDTAPTGTEWRLDGSPLRVVELRVRQPHARIPPTGAVLSYGGTDLPAPLVGLTVGTHVVLHTQWVSRLGRPAAEFEAAESVVGGAGLLRVHGRPIADWPATDQLGGAIFVNARHPRTLIGSDANGFIWLVAVDGRDATRSVGMTFDDLERVCDRLALTNALNLDGGGSTTMVVGGTVVNHPVGGPAPVNNALVVTRR